MQTTSLASAVDALRRAAESGGSRLSGQVLTDTARLNLTMLDDALTAVLERDDPRLAAAMAGIVEQFLHRVTRARLQLALKAEATGAHTLELEEYDAVREDRVDYSHPARHASARPCYKNPADFLASWLRIDFFEARDLLADAHRVIGRITIAGTPTTPRFERLGTTFQDPAIDPRTTLRAARSLEKLEPEDTIGQGMPLSPTARTAQGELLEERAAQILEGAEPRTTRKHIDTLMATYREEHTEAATPKLGLFKRRTINGVDEYVLRVRGADAGLMRSLITQADNPKTLAGAAARTRQPGLDGAEDESPAPSAPNQDPVDDPDPGPVDDPDPGPAAVPPQDDLPTPAWLQSDDPPPDWAIDQEAGDAVPNPASSSAATASSTADDSSTDGCATAYGLSTPEVSCTQEAHATTDGSFAAGRGYAGPTAAELVSAQLPVPVRRMNALITLLSQRATGSGKTKAIVPEILVHMHLDDLRDLATAHGITSHGVKLSAEELRHLLCIANIISVVFDAQGQVIDLARASRFYPDYLRKGIIARDKGCIVPGCTQPPENCDVHHFEDGGWKGGCHTSIGSGSLMCRSDHTAEQAGIIKVVKHNGLPHVILPKHIDPTQTPQRNTYWDRQ